MNTLFGGWTSVGQGFGPMTKSQTILLAVVVIWSFIWKGLALWRSAREKNTAWFIVFLIVNTLGILEIIYLYVFSNSAREARISRRTVRHAAKESHSTEENHSKE